MKKLLSPAEIHAEGGPSPSRQKKLRMHPGAFCPHIKIGASIYYERDEWERWLATRRRTHTRDVGQPAAA